MGDDGWMVGVRVWYWTGLSVAGVSFQPEWHEHGYRDFGQLTLRVLSKLMHFSPKSLLSAATQGSKVWQYAEAHTGTSQPKSSPLPPGQLVSIPFALLR